MASGSTQAPLISYPWLAAGSHSNWSGGPATVTVIWNAALPLRPPLAATLIVKLKVPVWVGFPVMTVPGPDWAGMLSPGGRVPETREKVSPVFGLLGTMATL